MAAYEITNVKFNGRVHTYQIVIDDKKFTIEDKNGNGKMDKGDSIREGENDVFEKYRATAQKIVSLFRQELPNELKNAVTGLGNTKFIKAPTPPGTRMPIPSMKTNNSGIYVADFDSDGKSDFVSFSTSAGTHIEISLPVAPPCEPDPLDMKVVEQYLRMFDD